MAPPVTALQFAGLVAGTFASVFLGRNRNREERALEARQLIRQDGPRPARWIAGRARVGGVIAAAFEVNRPAGPRTYPDGSPTPTNVPASSTLHLAVLLSDGPIEAIERVWIDGTELPFRVVEGSSTYRNGALWPDLEAHNSAIAGWKARAAALGASPEPVLASMQRDLRQRAEDLEAAQDFRWFFVRKPIGGQQPYGATCVISPDYGGAGVSPADLAGRHASQIESQVANEAGTTPAFQWTPSQRLDGISWAWVELTSFQEHRGEFGLSEPYPWPSKEPSIEFLLRGSLQANPARTARWFLTERCGVRATDIDQPSYDAAVATCDQAVDLPLPARGSTLATAWLNGAYGTQAAWPSTAEQDAFLQEVWNRYGGSRPRYTFNGIVEGDEERGSVVDALAGSMAGSIIDVGGSWHISAGRPQVAVRTLSEADLLGLPQVALAPAAEERINTVTGRLTYDAERDWQPTVLPPVVDATLVASDGPIERGYGDVPGAADEVTGRRLMAIQLRRSSPSLRRTTVELAPDALWQGWQLIHAGRTVQLDLPSIGIQRTTQWYVTQAAPGLDGSLRLSLIEERPGTYDADVDLTFGALWGGRQRSTGLGPAGTALGVNARATLTKIEGTLNTAPYKLDVQLRVGSSVRSLAFTLRGDGYAASSTTQDVIAYRARDFADVPAAGADGSEYLRTLNSYDEGGRQLQVGRLTAATLSVVPFDGTLDASGLPTGTPGTAITVPVLDAVPTYMAGLADVDRTAPTAGQILRRTSAGRWQATNPYIISASPPTSDSDVPDGTIWFQVTQG